MLNSDARSIVKELVDAVLQQDSNVESERKRFGKRYLDPFDPRYPDSAARKASLRKSKPKDRKGKTKHKPVVYPSRIDM
jgi:hypothetical protein